MPWPFGKRSSPPPPNDANEATPPASERPKPAPADCDSSAPPVSDADIKIIMPAYAVDPAPDRESENPPTSPARGPRVLARRDLVEVRDRELPGVTPRPWSSSPRDRWPSPGLVFRREAFLEIANHIDWGQVTSRNVVEQAGLLVGCAYRDGDTIWAEILAALPAHNARGSAAHMELGAEVMRELVADFHAQVAQNRWPREAGIVGWYHTHPNDLPVYMSGTDMHTQRTHFAKEWQFAVVLNPHSRVMRGFRGGAALECGLLLLEEGSAAGEALEKPPHRKGGDIRD